MKLTKDYRRNRIKMRVRKTVKGSDQVPRLSVFRSNKSIYAQLVDDLNGKTIVSANSNDKKLKFEDNNKTSQAFIVGQSLAKKATSKGITKCIFDRSGYLYHGRVKFLADGARDGGLKF